MSDQNIPLSYGAPSEAPPNFREVDEQEFVLNAMRRIYSPTRMEYRSFPITQTAYGRTSEPKTGITLNWYHNGKGDAILLDYHERRARFFLFAECEHEMKHTRNLGRCYNEYTCSKCGYVEQIDSGD